MLLQYQNYPPPPSHTHTLQRLRRRLCSQMLGPPHSRHWLRMRLCSHSSVPALAHAQTETKTMRRRRRRRRRHREKQYQTACSVHANIMQTYMQTYIRTHTHAHGISGSGFVCVHGSGRGVTATLFTAALLAAMLTDCRAATLLTADSSTLVRTNCGPACAFAREFK